MEDESFIMVWGGWGWGKVAWKKLCFRSRTPVSRGAYPGYLPNLLQQPRWEVLPG